MQNIRLLISGMLIILFPLNLLSQTDSTTSEKAKDRHALYAGAGYGNNMIYLGSTITQDMPFSYGALSYSFGGELSLTGSAFYLPALEPSAPAFSSLSLSYNHEFTKWLDIAAGVYRYMVKPSLSDTLFGNFNYADVTLGIDWKILYTEFSYGGFLVKNPPSYLQIKNSRYFETPSFFNGKANLSFYPYANLLFGNLTMTETWNGTEIITTTQTLVTPVSPSGTQGSGNGQGAGSGQGSGTGTGTGSSTTTTTTTTEVPVTTTVYSEKFKLIEMEIGLPVALNFNFMSVEADISYVFPTYSDPDYPTPKGFVLMFSAIFKIF